MANQIQAPAGPAAVVDRLRDAINGHDLDAMVACFSPDVRSRQPLHPSRQFQGSENIRQNWALIFGGVPDIRADLLRTITTGDTAWAEWQWSGNSSDGRRFDMRGVTVQDVVEGAITEVSLYMEPVEVGSGSNIDAIQATVGAPR